MLSQPPYFPPTAHAALLLWRGSGGTAAALGGRQGQAHGSPGWCRAARRSGRRARAGCAPHGARGQERPAPGAGLRATGGSTPCRGQTRPPGPETSTAPTVGPATISAGESAQGAAPAETRRARAAPHASTGARRDAPGCPAEPGTEERRLAPPQSRSQSRSRLRPCLHRGPLRPGQGDARSPGFTFAPAATHPAALRRGRRAAAPRCAPAVLMRRRQDLPAPQRVTGPAAPRPRASAAAGSAVPCPAGPHGWSSAARVCGVNLPGWPLLHQPPAPELYVLL